MKLGLTVGLVVLARLVLLSCIEHTAYTYICIRARFIDEDVLETNMVDVNAVDTNGLDVGKADTTHLYHDN